MSAGVSLQTLDKRVYSLEEYKRNKEMLEKERGEERQAICRNHIERTTVIEGTVKKHEEKINAIKYGWRTQAISLLIQLLTIILLLIKK